MVLTLDDFKKGDKLIPKEDQTYSNYLALKHLKEVEYLKPYDNPWGNSALIQVRITEGKARDRSSGTTYYEGDIIELNLEHVLFKNKNTHTISLTRHNVQLGEILIPNGRGKQSNYFTLNNLEEVEVIELPTPFGYDLNYFTAKILKGKTYNNYYGRNHTKGAKIRVDLRNFMRKTPKRTQIPFAIWF